MLGIGIGCACGATATLILVFIVSFFKSKCRSPKIASPRVKTVEPLNGGPHMRTPSVNGSVDSSDSISHSRNGFIRRPLTTSRRSSMIDGKSNGFLPWCITGPRLWKRKYRSVEHCNWNEKGSHIQCYVTPCREASCASHKGDARDTKHQTISKTIWSDWEVSLLKIVRDWCNTLLTVKNYSHSHTYRVLILHLIFCIHVFS